MMGGRPAGFGRRRASHRLQARPRFAWLFVLRPLGPACPEAPRSENLRAIDRWLQPG